MVKHKSKTQLTVEEKAAKATRARRRFRAAIRLAVENQFWLEDFSDMQLGENVKKNIRILTQATKKKSNFTIEQKSIMSTEKENRTEEEKKKLHRALGGIKCFRRYPTSVQEQLAEVSYFRYIPPKRTMVRQDDDARALFFILSGEVAVYRTTFDPVLNEWVTNEVGTREAGTMFGEVSLLHGVRRTATVITSDHCEMLILRKEDFDAVLKSTVMAEWEEIRECMSKFSYFDTWDDMAVRDCCILSKVKMYEPEEIVLSSDVGDKRCAYFLVEGQCDLVEYLELEVTEIGCKKYYQLVTDADERAKDVALLDKKDTASIIIDHGTTLVDIKSYGKMSSVHDRLGSTLSLGTLSLRQKSTQTHFMKVATFNSLSTFHIGENFVRRFVIATKETKVLAIPAYWLMQKNREIWNYIKNFLNQRLPNTQALFKDFIAEKKWCAYRRNLVEEILSNCKKVNLNNIHNVPYSIRMHEDMSYYECREAMKRNIFKKIRKMTEKTVERNTNIDNVERRVSF